MSNKKKCNLETLVPTKTEINFTNQYGDLIDKLQHHTDFRKIQGGNGVVPSLMQQATNMIAKSIDQIGVQGTAKVVTLFMPKDIQNKIINSGKHEHELTGGRGRRTSRKKTQKRNGGNSEIMSSAKVYSVERRSSEKRSSAKKSASDKKERTKIVDNDDDNDVYLGERNEKNEKHGKGKMTYSNGDVYDGEWKNNKRHGEGTITFQNKTTYKGRWINDKINGYGEFKYFNGDSYEGTFHNGVKSGDGKMTYENGNVYKGFWKNDFRDGKGKLTYKNEDVFEGIWRKDKRNGPGKLMKKTGEVVEDTWEDDDTIMGQITGTVTSLGSVVQPAVDSIISSQSKLLPLTYACGGFTTLLGSLQTMKESFSRLLFGRVSNDLLDKMNNILASSKTAQTNIESTVTSLFNALKDDPVLKVTYPTEDSMNKYFRTVADDYNRGIFEKMDSSLGGYGVYIAGIGLVTLGYFIYLRMFGDEEQNDILDKEIRRKKSLSTKKRRR